MTADIHELIDALDDLFNETIARGHAATSHAERISTSFEAEGILDALRTVERWAGPEIVQAYYEAREET